ncbi:MAG: hypothetical protein KJ723_07350 [candidate division Zixibacteria bacterium]|nr:hypothetical protein [candidate division Zixibacteria bacterium]
MPIQTCKHATYLPILILLLSFSGTSAQTVKITNVTGNIYESETITEQLDFDGITRLAFTASSGFTGTISMKTSATGTRLVYSEHFKARSLDEAENFAKYIKLVSDKSNGVLVLRADAERGAPWQGTDQSARLEIELVLPESLGIDLQAEYFDINIQGPFTIVEVLNDYGRIRVSNVTQMLKILTENSRVNLDNIQGAIDVTTSNNMIRAQKIDTKDGMALFRNEYGVIEISRLTGVVECVTSYSAIDLRGIKLTSGRSRFVTTYGSIDAEIIELKDAELYVTDDFSNVELILPEDVEAEFDLNVERGGRIHMTGITVTSEEMGRHRLVAHTDNPESKVNVDISGIGTVSIQGKKFYGVP